MNGLLFFVVVFCFLVGKAFTQLFPPNCLPILEGDFNEYYEVHGKCANLLTYKANINMSVQDTFTDNHFYGEQFRIIVSDLDPKNVALLVKYPKKWRFYSFDKDDYFTREFEQVDYEHMFVYKNHVFYNKEGGFFRMNAGDVNEELSEQKLNLTDYFDDEELRQIDEMCWNNSSHCYSDSGHLMQETLTNHFVVQMLEELQVVATHNSNQFYIHDLVTGFDFCFPNTLKTHLDCELETDSNKFAEVQSRFPIIGKDLGFLERRKELLGKGIEEAAKLSKGMEKQGC